MDKKELLKLPIIDQLKLSIEESLKDHKNFKTEYWKGSAFMAKNILDTIELLKNHNKLNNG